MKYYLLPFIALLFLCPSCAHQRNHEAGRLMVVSMKTAIVEDLDPDCFLNLKKNGRYTLFIPDYFDYGYWKRVEKEQQPDCIYQQKVAKILW